MTIVLEDKRSDCLSALISTTVKTYLSFAETVYKNKGGIKGQRAPLKTKTGQRIRNRMVEDIKKGTILPPIVVGAVLDINEFEKAKSFTTNEQFESFFNNMPEDKLSIIDGMQRTTAILDASLDSDVSQNPVRVEFWLAKNVNSLIYRMLVLNTGQVPWDMQRQLQTVYEPILSEVKKVIKDIDVFLVDDINRRSQPGQYRGSKLVEFFLTFSSRKVKLDLKEKVAEDFARLDAIEATSHPTFIPYFIDSLNLMKRIDQQFGRSIQSDSTPDYEGKIKSGKDIFTSAPAGIGFMVACAVMLYGHPGFSLKPEEDSEKSLNKIKASVESLVRKLEGMSPEKVFDFLDLSGLNERLSRKSGKVGEFERDFYFKAFSAMFEHSDALETMEPCWAAY